MRALAIPATVIILGVLVGCSASRPDPSHSSSQELSVTDPSPLKTFADSQFTLAQGCDTLAGITQRVARDNEVSRVASLTSGDQRTLTSVLLGSPASEFASDLYTFSSDSSVFGVGTPQYFSDVEAMAKDCSSRSGLTSFHLWNSSRKPQTVAQFEASMVASPLPAQPATRPSPTSAAPMEDQYVLRVTGNGSAVITYVTDSGETQRTVALPWSTTLPTTDVPSGIVALSAQEQQSGTIGCSIQLSNGHPVTQNSSGPYAVVSCVFR
jgi:hypothetical protein